MTNTLDSVSMSKSKPRSSVKDLLREKNDIIRRQNCEIAELKKQLDKLRKDLQKQNAIATKIKVRHPLNLNTTSVLSYGLQIVGFEIGRQDVAEELLMKRFRSHFGIGPKAIIAILKDMTDIDLEKLLMTLCWFKLYETEHVMAGRWGHCEEFCRRTVKDIALKVQQLKSKKIKFGPFDSSQRYVGTIDCVHCETFEFRTEPHSKWYSHKHNGAGLTYEVVIDLVYDRVLWVYGPEPASTHDITMFRGGAQIDSSLRNNKENWDRSALYFRIPQGKKLIGDSGYKGEPTKISTTVAEHSRDVKEFFARAKSRQETFNTRLKFFNVLSGCFRHGKGAKQKLELHKTCFEAICILVQYDLENGHPLMEI